MSLENDLKRIADALEKIAGSTGSTGVAPAVTAAVEEVVTPPPAPKKKKEKAEKVAEIPPAPKQEAAVPPAPPKTSAEPAAAPVPPKTNAQPQAVPSAPAPMSAADLNKALVAEYQRLGSNREPIDKAMREMGVQSVNDLAAEKYQELLDKVRAIPAPAAA